MCVTGLINTHARLLSMSDFSVVMTLIFPQVDLSEDYTILAIFSDGEWEKEMTGITFSDGAKGATKQLKMDAGQFRMITGFGKDAATSE